MPDLTKSNSVIVERLNERIDELTRAMGSNYYSATFLDESTIHLNRAKELKTLLEARNLV